MEENKKVKGSAILMPNGSFVFKPYAQKGGHVQEAIVIQTGNYASLKISKNKIGARLDFARSEIPPFAVWIEEMTTVYNTLILNLHEDL